MGAKPWDRIEAWYQSPPIGIRVRSSKWTIGCTAFGACFTDGFLYGAIVPILPFSLTQRSGLPEEQVQFWVSLLLSVFGFSVGVGAPIAGWVADKGSRTMPFLVGLLLATIATILFCFAHAVKWLVLGRILQGLGTSVIYTAGLALIADAVEVDEIGAWMGFVFSGVTFGLLFAPLIAGVVYDHAGYYAVFGIIFGVFGLDLVLRLFMIEKREAIKWIPGREIDTTAQPDEPADGTGHANADEYQHVRGEEDVAFENQDSIERPASTEPDEQTALLGRKSIPLGRRLHRMFPKMVTLTSSPRLIAAVYGCFTHAMLIACIDAILPLFVKRAFHWTASGAGAIFLTISCPSLFGTLFGSLSDRYGSRPVALAGLIFTTINLGLMGIVRQDTMLDKVILCLFLVLVGIGLNLLLAPLAADIFAEIELLTADHPQTFGETGAYAQGYSLMCGALGFGAAIGPIVAGLVYNCTNWPITMGFLAIICALPSVGVFLYTGRSGKQRT